MHRIVLRPIGAAAGPPKVLLAAAGLPKGLLAANTNTPNISDESNHLARSVQRGRNGAGSSPSMRFAKPRTTRCPFLGGASNTRSESAVASFSVFLENRIDVLWSIVDQREIHSMLYFYLQSKKGVTHVFARLDWFEYKDRIMFVMLMPWKLETAGKDEDPVDASLVKTARKWQDLWLADMDAWKMHKQEVFVAGWKAGPSLFGSCRQQHQGRCCARL
jgi:hypothetical protein